MGAVIGQVMLAETAMVFTVTTMFVVLGAFGLIGAVAGGLWWLRGVEGRGVSVEVLGTPVGAEAQT